MNRVAAFLCRTYYTWRAHRRVHRIIWKMAKRAEYMAILTLHEHPIMDKRAADIDGTSAALSASFGILWETAHRLDGRIWLAMTEQFGQRGDVRMPIFTQPGMFEKH